MNYFDSETYNNLYGILLDEFPELAGEFAGLFTPTGDYYVVNDIDAYTEWLTEKLFAGETPDEDWFAWSGMITGKSTDGSGKE